MTKKTIAITTGIEPLYGTHDENLRLMEDTLRVTIDLRSDGIHVCGEPDAVTRVQCIMKNGTIHSVAEIMAPFLKSDTGNDICPAQ